MGLTNRQGVTRFHSMKKHFTAADHRGLSRCEATVVLSDKTGAACMRRTVEGSRYCWQHQPKPEVDVEYIRVRLAPTEMNAVEWAADAANPFWRDRAEREDEGNRGYDVNVISVARESVGIIADPAVLEDLRYRLIEQLPDMAASEATDDMSVKRSLKAAYSAWEKISRAATG
jgi:hypothetical protein